MIPVKTIEELILKHSTLEKDLSSGDVDKKLFAEKSKEYSDVNEIIEQAKNYLSFKNDKKELSKIPIFKSIIDKAGFIFVDRKNNDEAIKSMNKLTSDIKKNPRSIAVFPEGTRTEDGKLKEFKKGATVLSLNTKIPIVPVGISGSFKWAKKRLFDFSKSKIIIEFSKPINPKNFSYSQREDLNNLIKTNVEKMIRV